MYMDTRVGTGCGSRAGGRGGGGGGARQGRATAENRDNCNRTINIF